MANYVSWTMNLNVYLFKGTMCLQNFPLPKLSFDHLTNGDKIYNAIKLKKLITMKV